MECAESRSSIDSLAAVAVAFAKEEEGFANGHDVLLSDSCLIPTTTNGPPSRNRAAVDYSMSSAKLSTPKGEAVAAALAADTILEAAAALQPKE